jgi:hypothetical protein
MWRRKKLYARTSKLVVSRLFPAVVQLNLPFESHRPIKDQVSQAASPSQPKAATRGLLGSWALGHSSSPLSLFQIGASLPTRPPQLSGALLPSTEHHQVRPPLDVPFLPCEAVRANLNLVRRYALPLVFPSCCAKPCVQTLTYYSYSELNLITSVYAYIDCFANRANRARR